jgi:hypothetical protein
MKRTLVRCEVDRRVDEAAIPITRITHFHGFGLLRGRHFTHEAELPLFACFFRLVCRTLLRLGVQSDTTVSLYAPRPSSHRLSTVYMLLEDVHSHDS